MLWNASFLIVIFSPLSQNGICLWTILVFVDLALCIEMQLFLWRLYHGQKYIYLAMKHNTIAIIFPLIRFGFRKSMKRNDLQLKNHSFHILKINFTRPNSSSIIKNQVFSPFSVPFWPFLEHILLYFVL